MIVRITGPGIARAYLPRVGFYTKQHVPGLLAGLALAPLTALGSYLRRSRLFHPRGLCLRGVVRPAAGDLAFREAGLRLAGPVFVRFSSAWWKWREWPDVLGCALRFTSDGTVDPAPRATDQDLLMATIRTPLTTMLAPLSTHVDDYMSNAYFGVAPFAVPTLGRVKLRLSPVEPAPPGITREQRLTRALDRAPLQLTLEARAHRLGSRYKPLAHVELGERVQLDQGELRFDPFACGRGFKPVGFVHGLRVASYAASRRARDAARRQAGAASDQP
jgi:hypothetical protein